MKKREQVRGQKFQSRLSKPKFLRHVVVRSNNFFCLAKLNLKNTTLYHISVRKRPKAWPTCGKLYHDEPGRPALFPSLGKEEIYIRKGSRNGFWPAKNRGGIVTSPPSSAPPPPLFTTPPSPTPGRALKSRYWPKLAIPSVRAEQEIFNSSIRAPWIGFPIEHWSARGGGGGCVRVVMGNGEPSFHLSLVHFQSLGCRTFVLSAIWFIFPFHYLHDGSFVFASEHVTCIMTERKVSNKILTYIIFFIFYFHTCCTDFCISL